MLDELLYLNPDWKKLVIHRILLVLTRHQVTTDHLYPNLKKHLYGHRFCTTDDRRMAEGAVVQRW